MRKGFTTGSLRKKGLLRVSAGEYKELFESMLEGCHIIGSDWRYLYLNGTGEKHSRRPRAELLGRTFAECWPGITETRIFSRIEDCLQKRTVHKLEEQFTFPNGECGWFRLIIQPLAGGVVIYSEDITERRKMEEVLRAGEERLQLFIEHAPASLAMFDTEMRYLSASRRWRSNYRIFDRELIGECHYDIFPEIPAAWREAHRRGLCGEVVKSEGDRFERADGTVQWVRWEIRPWYGPSEGIGGIVLFTEDITGIKQAEEALRESDRRFRNLLGQVQLISVILDQNARVTFCNDYLLRLTGWTREEVLGSDWFERFISPENREIRGLFAELLENPAASSHFQNEILTRAGERRLIRWNNTVLYSSSGEVIGTASIGEDVTERRLYEEHLEHLATHDELTGLANRALLLDRLEQSIRFALRSGRLVAVLLLDLDRFKIINDSLGHAFGDQVLWGLGQRLQQSVRSADTVARLGGDEFVIVLAEIAEPEDVGLFAAKILRNLAEPLTIDGREIIITASLGISLYPRDSEDAAMLVRNADMAMYRAKGEDRSTFAFYSPEMNQRILEALELESALRQALELNEFCLHYQPKVDLVSGRVVGCEALVRWRHPERGMILPADFIPMAEETGLIVPLGTWVLKEACRQARAWRDQGLDLGVAVNLSARQFRKGDLPQIIREILSETDLDPRFLELELTESMVMGDPAEAQRTMHILKELGVGLSLDDFGTGYSSLNYLRRFPVDSLKIDISFIRDVVTDPSGASVVASIIDIAHNLGLTAVAEGVETNAQLDFLTRCGCDLLQGYLFSKPLPAKEFTELLGQGRRLAVSRR